MSVSSIRDGLETRLATISGLRAFDLVQGKIPTPAAWVKPVDIDETGFDDNYDYDFAVEVFVSVNSMRAGQDQLDGYVSPSGSSSVIVALEGDKTLGGAADDLAAKLRPGSYGLVEVNGTVYLGATVDVTVYT